MVETTPPGTGISLSGGGVRSAAFCLGAIQALQDNKQLMHGPTSATHLAAVSGGAYSAAAFCLAAGGVLDTPSIRYVAPKHHWWNFRKHQEVRLPKFSPDGHPMVEGESGRSLVEEDQHAPDRDGELPTKSGGNECLPKYVRRAIKEQDDENWESVDKPDHPMMLGMPENDFVRSHAKYLIEPGGVALTALTVLCVSGGQVFFMLLGAFILGLLAGAVVEAANELLVWILVAAGIVSYLLLLTAMLWFSTREYSRRMFVRTRTEIDALVGDLLWIGLFVISVFGLGLGINSMVDIWSPSPDDPSASAKLVVTWTSTLLGAVVAVVPIALGAVAAVRSRIIALPAPFPSNVQRISRFAMLVATKILQLLVSLLIPAILLGTALGGWNVATNADQVVGVSLGVFAGFYLAVLRWMGFGTSKVTLFDPYRRRLASCFDVIRQIHKQTGALRVRQRMITPRMSTLGSMAGSIPELRICASVNISEAGTTPAGSQARQVVFSPHHMRIRGVTDVEISMKDLERLYSKRWGLRDSFTPDVMSLVAVTSAAVSPSMGKFTVAWLRGVIGFFNFRLGVWMPNPASESVQSVVSQGVDARLARQLGKPPGFYQYFRELRGKHFLRANRIYVSDGGHYENLGLVELVREGCPVIWCIDASADPPGTCLTIAESLTIVTSELGYLVDIDLAPFDAIDSIEGDKSRIAMIGDTHVVGRIRSPRNDAKPVDIELHIVKIGVFAQTDSRLIAMRGRYRNFPYDSTLNQLFNAEKFDIYRDLGYDSTTRALCSGSS